MTLSDDERKSQRSGRTGLRLSVLAAGIAVCLLFMGRTWWCATGDLRPWSWDIWSQHNSQHFIDPYTISHFQHGLGLYLAVTLLLGRFTTASTRLLSVASVEAAWELTENTDWMIERYRASTISLDYFGDSILNSLGDYTACVAGALLARAIPWRYTLGLFVLLEAVSISWIRDSLLLNVVMLIHPFELILQWQQG